MLPDNIQTPTSNTNNAPWADRRWARPRTCYRARRRGCWGCLAGSLVHSRAPGRRPGQGPRTLPETAGRCHVVTLGSRGEGKKVWRHTTIAYFLTAAGRLKRYSLRFTCLLKGLEYSTMKICSIICSRLQMFLTFPFTFLDFLAFKHAECLLKRFKRPAAVIKTDYSHGDVQETGED